MQPDSQLPRLKVPIFSQINPVHAPTQLPEDPF